MNTHTKKIHVIHVSTSIDEKHKSTPQNGFYTKETFDKILDEMESRDLPVNCNIELFSILCDASGSEKSKMAAHK